MAGYHEADIPRGVFGERSKIEEELAELIDAERQGVRIMAMCELSDLFGALVEYASRKYGRAVRGGLGPHGARDREGIPGGAAQMNGKAYRGDNVKQVILDRLSLVVYNIITKETLHDALRERHSDHVLAQAEWAVHPAVVGMAMELRAWLLKSRHNDTERLSVTVPRTWWDHLKHDILRGKPENPWRRFFQIIIKRFAPPRYRTETKTVETVVRVCPHNDCYFSESNKHLDFLTYGGKSDEGGKADEPARQA